jgi:radical SAM-linked protein
MLDAISNTSSFTLAPEAGSERLRRIINKDFSEEAIFEAVEMLMRRNVQTLKLYFMIGLPTEENADIDAIIRLIESIAAMVGKRSRRRMVHISISPFSPKAQTPFQWEAMAPIDVLLEKSRYIKHSLGHCRNVKIAYHEPEITYLETVMARGDRGLSALIHEAWRSGARSDAWSEHFDFNRWKTAAEKLSIDLDRYTSALPLDQPLPWAAITNGASGKFLLRERSRAMEGVPTPDCRKGQCNGCGVCDGKKIKRLVIASAKVTEQIPTAQLTDNGFPEKADPHFYRIVYSKKNNMRFLGHRDMMNIFHRASIAASIPIAFSNGFHPNPRISFGPPLPFGVSGHTELFDIITNAPVAAEALSSINRWLPTGLEIYDSIGLQRLEESLSAMVAAGDYVFLPLFDSAGEELDRIVKGAIAQNEIIVNDSSIEGSEGEIRTKNIRPLIKELRIVVERDRTGIEAVLSMLPKATCRPSELIAGLFSGRAFEDFAIYRKECLKRQGEKLVSILSRK